MNIGIDMMGGDFAPLEAVKGVKLFLENQLTVHSSQLTVNLQPSTVNKYYLPTIFKPSPEKCFTKESTSVLTK